MENVKDGEGGRNANNNFTAVELGARIALILIFSIASAALGAAIGGSVGKLIKFLPLWVVIIAHVHNYERRPLASVGLTATPRAWGLLLFIFIPGGAMRLVQAGAEELVYRGFIMNRINDERSGPVWALLISALLFTIMHGPNSNFIQIFIFGLLTGGLVLLRNGEIWWTIAIHTMWNLRLDMLQPL